MRALELLTPDLVITPDHSVSDIEQELKQNTLIQQSLQAYFRGQITVADIEDVLSECGIDPIEYWQVVTENIESVSDRQLQQVEDTDSLILLPGRDF
jgi:hypothetical protein